MYDVVEAHAMYGCCAAIVSHVRIYIWVSADWNDDRQRVKTHLPRVEGVDGLMFEEEAYGYNYLLLDSELAVTVESAGPETLTYMKP